jgi:predicted transcriptional regulator
MLVVQPEELRAWRMRLGLKQEQVAKRAKMTQQRVADAEIRLLGTVTTYIKLNRALTSLEAERTQAIAA